MFGEAAEGTVKALTNEKVTKELSKAKVFTGNAMTGSANKAVGEAKVGALEATIKGNEKTSEIMGAAIGETTNQAAKNKRT